MGKEALARGTGTVEQTARLPRLPGWAIWAGRIWPALFGGALLILTGLQYDFLRGLGWGPLRAASLDWPSGLALGPLGGWMTAVFLACGALIGVFAAGLQRTLRASRSGRWAARLFGVAGLGMALLAFPADPTLRDTPATLPGRLHDGAYVLLGAALFPAMLLLGRWFWRQPGGRSRAGLTWLAAALALPAFALKGVLIYLFLGSLLLWAELAVVWLQRGFDQKP